MINNTTSATTAYFNSAHDAEDAVEIARYVRERLTSDTHFDIFAYVVVRRATEGNNPVCQGCFIDDVLAEVDRKHSLH